MRTLETKKIHFNDKQGGPSAQREFGLNSSTNKPSCRKDPVGLGEGFLGTDVVPDARNAPGHHRGAWIEPLDQASRLVGIVALGDVLADRGQVPARVVVQSDPDPRAGRFGRFLHKTGDAPRPIDVDDAVLAGLFQAAHVIDPEHRPILGSAVIAEAPETLVEEVVTGHHNQVVIESLLLEHQVEIANGPELVGLVRRSIVDHREAERVVGGLPVRLGPLRKMPGELRVAHNEHLVDAPDGSQVVHDVIDHGFASDRQQRLGLGERQRIQPRGIAGGKNQNFHKFNSFTSNLIDITNLTELKQRHL